MAYIWEAWERDGPNGEARADWFRSDQPDIRKNPAQVQAGIESWKRRSNVVRITRSRTESPEKPWREIWLRPGYVDPF